MIQEPLQIFMLEDLPTDRALVKRQVMKVFPNAKYTMVTKRAEFEEKVGWTRPDLVLADYNLVDFNGLEALLFFKEKYPEIPFVFITGTLSDEEQVAETILKGASGYILKQNLDKLPEKLTAIYRQYQDRIGQSKTQVERRRELHLKLQKAKELVESASDFQQKHAVVDLLAEVLHNTI
ncbi:MAG: response regulator [Phaeodactylibacter sp.]|nr:response regulator [Phaeodactylibacter sp.]